MLTLDKIYHASYVLKDVIRQTNIVQARGICDDCDVYLKPENLQITGSFKVRGSGYKISQLIEEEKARGVIACSAGNHAQGVALAATKYGIKSLICLPDGAPISKVEATKNYGAEVCMVPGVYDDAYNEALRLRDEKNYTFIHPFDDENVIAGQGTIGIEIMVFRQRALLQWLSQSRTASLFILTAFLQLPTVFRLKNRVSIHLNM